MLARSRSRDLFSGGETLTPEEETMTTPSPLLLSPQEYLEEQQREAMRQDRALSPLSLEIGDILASGLLASLSDDQRAILREFQVAVGVLPGRQIDAFVQETPSRHGRIICYSYGLMSFLIALNKILLCRVTLPFQGLEPTIGPEDALKRVREAMDWFYKDIEPFPRFTLDTIRTLMASKLAQTQAAFVIGHELGHIIARHLDAPRPKRLTEARDREFEADERGVEMVLSSYRRRNDLGATNELALVQAGIDVVFTYLQFVADYQGNTFVDPPHPSAEDRRQHFRTRYGAELPVLAKDLGDQAAVLFQWFGSNLHLIESLGPDSTAGADRRDKCASRPGDEGRSVASPLRDTLEEIAELAEAAVGGGDGLREGV
jgi:hypothetical protein